MPSKLYVLLSHLVSRAGCGIDCVDSCALPFVYFDCCYSGSITKCDVSISNIGIRHDFLCINISLTPREVLKPEPERRGFQDLPRRPAYVNVSEKHV